MEQAKDDLQRNLKIRSIRSDWHTKLHLVDLGVTGYAVISGRRRDGALLEVDREA